MGILSAERGSLFFTGYNNGAEDLFAATIKKCTKPDRVNGSAALPSGTLQRRLGDLPTSLAVQEVSPFSMSLPDVSGALANMNYSFPLTLNFKAHIIS